jgi:hypothetical protein
MAKTVDPGAPENLQPENALKGSVTKKDEGAAHSIQARRSLLHWSARMYSAFRGSLCAMSAKGRAAE